MSESLKSKVISSDYFARPGVAPNIIWFILSRQSTFTVIREKKKKQQMVSWQVKAETNVVYIKWLVNNNCRPVWRGVGVMFWNLFLVNFLATGVKLWEQVAKQLVQDFDCGLHASTIALFFLKHFNKIFNIWSIKKHKTNTKQKTDLLFRELL